MVFLYWPRFFPTLGGSPSFFAFGVLASFLTILVSGCSGKGAKYPLVLVVVVAWSDVFVLVVGRECNCVGGRGMALKASDVW